MLMKVYKALISQGRSQQSPRFLAAVKVQSMRTLKWATLMKPQITPCKGNIDSGLCSGNPSVQPKGFKAERWRSQTIHMKREQPQKKLKYRRNERSAIASLFSLLLPKWSSQAYMITAAVCMFLMVSCSRNKGLWVQIFQLSLNTLILQFLLWTLTRSGLQV